MYNPEGQYIRNIDNQAKEQLPPDIGFATEGIVVDYFNNNFPGITARPATDFEDSGVNQINRGKQIDVVIYEGDEAVLCAQITTARDPKVQNEKLQQLMDRPFVRLPGSKPKDNSVPKVLIGLDPQVVISFFDDNDFSKHPEISNKILKDVSLGLTFDLTKTRDLKEQQRIKKLLDIFSSKNTFN